MSKVKRLTGGELTGRFTRGATSSTSHRVILSGCCPTTCPRSGKAGRHVGAASDASHSSTSCPDGSEHPTCMRWPQSPYSFAAFPSREKFEGAAAMQPAGFQRALLVRTTSVPLKAGSPGCGTERVLRDILSSSWPATALSAAGAGGGLGYVVRRPDPRDQRAKLIVLTRKGRAASSRSVHHQGSRGRDHPVTRPAGTSSAAANARFVHHLVLTPNTRSQRLKAPSAMGAGSWIQGTRWAANPGARRSTKL